MIGFKFLGKILSCWRGSSSVKLEQICFLKFKVENVFSQIYFLPHTDFMPALNFLIFWDDFTKESRINYPQV
jgi:hypothetical protein